MRKNMYEVKRIVIALSLTGVFVAKSQAQMLIGTQGMMNTPTADMKEAGTFVGGVSYVPQEMDMAPGNYNTGIYYISFTPFKWMECAFRETLLKTTKVKNGEVKRGYYQQDRSTTFRLRPFAEKDSTLLPSVVAGVNDIYSDHGSSRYTSVYGVVTKHVPLWRAGRLGLNVGYARKFDTGVVYDGVFGGIEFRPSFAENMRVMAEWDTSGLNVGAHLLAFRHLNLMVYTREFKCLGAGISYQYTISY